MTIGIITFTVDEDANIHGTSKKLTVSAPFHRMVELFGEPLTIEDGDHVRIHWPVVFSDGAVMDVYDWNESVPVEEVTQWNVGSKEFMTAGRIYDILHNRRIIA